MIAFATLSGRVVHYPAPTLCPRGHVPVIDRNIRGQHEAKTECAEKVARMKFIGMPDPDDTLYRYPHHGRTRQPYKQLPSTP